MTCQVVSSQSQLQARLPPLPATLPSTQGQWTAFLNTLNQWAQALQQEQHPPNVIPSQFQTFTTAAASSTVAALTASNCTPSVDATQQYYGAASLKVTISASGATLAFSGYPISIAAATRWFASWQLYAPSGCTGSLTIKTAGGHSITESFTVSALASWQQVWGLFDLRQYADTTATWQFTFTSTATVWIDGMQMNAIGDPISFLPRFAGTQMVLGASAYAANLDGIADGTARIAFDPVSKRRGVSYGQNLAINGDFGRGDNRNWTGSPEQTSVTTAFSGPTVSQDSTANIGGYSAVFGGSGGQILTDYLIPVDTTKSYYIEARVKDGGGTAGQTFYMGFACFDSTKTSIPIEPPGATFNYDLAANIAQPAAWTIYSDIISGVELQGNHSVAPNDSQFTSHSKFRYGTAYICPLVLQNRGAAGGLFAIDYVRIVQISSLDHEVGDGSTYLRMPGSNMDSNRRGLIDFTQAGHLSKNLDNIVDGTTYGRPLNTALNAGQVDLSKAGVISKTLVNVADDPGSSRFAVASIDGNRRALVDFTQAGHLSKNLDNIADGSTYGRPLGSRLSSGKPWIDFSESIHANKNTDNIPPGTGTGATTLAVIGVQRNLIPDSGLKSGNLYWAAASGWSITVNLDGFTNCWEYVGTGSPSGFTFPATVAIPINPGTYTLSAVVAGGNITSGTAFIGVYNTAISTSYGNITFTTSSGGRISGQITIPAGVSQVKVIIDTDNCTVANGAGMFVQQIQLEAGAVMTAYQETVGDQLAGSILIDFAKSGHGNKILDNIADGSTYGRPLLSRLSSGKPWIDFSEAIHANKILDNIADGTTYARVKASGMTGNLVDPSKSGITANGCIPPMIPTVGFSWTTSSGQVTISWPAFTLYRPDGTTTSISAGAGTTVTGLTNGTVYTVYPYIVDGQTTVSFATGKTGATGTPAICYAGGSATAAQLMYEFANIPLNSFTVTAASGGGGGGGDQVGCLHPDTMIERARGCPIMAGELAVGDLLRGPKGEARVTHVSRMRCAEWAQVRFRNVGTVTATLDHRFIRPDGELVRAGDLHLGDIIAGEGRNVEVESLELVREEKLLVAVNVSEPHLYYVGGALSHNGNPKP